MSHLDIQKNGGGPELDLSESLTFFAVLRIKEQVRSGRRVIFEIGHRLHPSKLTFGIDPTDQLKIWLVDQRGEEFSTEGIPWEAFFQKELLAVIELTPKKSARRRYQGAELRLTIENSERIERIKNIKRAQLGGREPASMTIGADLDGGQNAAFFLKELIQYGSNLSNEDKAKLRQAILEKWELGDHVG